MVHPDFKTYWILFSFSSKNQTTCASSWHLNQYQNFYVLLSICLSNKFIVTQNMAHKSYSSRADQSSAKWFSTYILIIYWKECSFWWDIKNFQIQHFFVTIHESSWITKFLRQKIRYHLHEESYNVNNAP